MMYRDANLDRIELPRFIREGDSVVPTAPIVDAQDWARLALAGYYRELRETLPPGVQNYGTPWLDESTGRAVIPAATVDEAERLAVLRAAAVSETKTEASRQIEEVWDLPQWRQQNLQTQALFALMQGCILLRGALTVGVVTPADGAALDALGISDAADKSGTTLGALALMGESALAVRQASDQIEAWIAAAAIDDLADFDAASPPPAAPQWSVPQ